MTKQIARDDTLSSIVENDILLIKKQQHMYTTDKQPQRTTWKYMETKQQLCNVLKCFSRTPLRRLKIFTACVYGRPNSKMESVCHDRDPQKKKD